MRILKSQQAAAQFKRRRPVQYSYATIGEVFADGVTLIFSGETEASQKHYACNGDATFKTGQCVYINAVNDTYFVVCPVLGGT